ncbi:hypothetical protein THSYN_27480 [Candidatus Thiodictyon syntrophicum]|jgi:hypothetical protein|uniref:DUF2845 domain-containing protein n=2 Tax=Candidatus Thiodictyon syntrophicum TaxID=1166950 RepID=A0A2K8UFF4_9GAMM|nr:hypothetical protein THSYN_27480 [Candidatus Thiodictyon syntrophicum]
MVAQHLAAHMKKRTNEMLPEKVNFSCMVVLVATMLPLAAANADFRCRDGNLINTGDSMSYLMNKCGSPMSQSDLVNNFGAVIGQRLRYEDRNDSSWVYVVDIYSGKVTRVVTERQ